MRMDAGKPSVRQPPPPRRTRRWGAWRALAESGARERARILGEIGEIRGLMPLLMKRRNGMPWSSEEKRLLRDQLRSLAHLSPYLAMAALPGTFAVLPLLAWWLDRRRRQRSAH